MKAHVHKTMQLGALVVAAFDEAARRSSNPREVSRWATTAVEHALRLGGRTSLSRTLLAIESLDSECAPRAKYLLATPGQ